jgi:hypothetical protein
MATNDKDNGNTQQAPRSVPIEKYYDRQKNENNSIAYDYSIRRENFNIVTNRQEQDPAPTKPKN